MTVSGASWIGFQVYLPSRGQLSSPRLTRFTCDSSSQCSNVQPAALSSSFGGAMAMAGTRTRFRRMRSGVVPLRAAGQEASTSTLVVQEVEFTWSVPGSVEVLLTGDFLQWETKLALQKASNGVFSVKQKLPAGRYSYKFIVDGEWKHSPDSPTVPDEKGGFNNEVLVVNPSAIAADNPTSPPPKAANSVAKPAVPISKQSGDALPSKQSGDALPSKQSGDTPPSPPKKTIPKPSAPPPEPSLEATMTETIIPLLERALSKEEGLFDIDIKFEDNQLKTSFSKDDTPICCWAFFPDGSISGSRGFSLASRGSPPSTIEPFLVDEKKITPELVVFWITKRLFAQKYLALN